jgi:hypothetical protein
LYALKSFLIIYMVIDMEAVARIWCLSTVTVSGGDEKCVLAEFAKAVHF